MAQRTITIFECDHPSCNKTIDAKGGKVNPSPLTGFYGDIARGERPNAKSRWYACKHAHISGAVKVIAAKFATEPSPRDIEAYPNAG